MPSPGPVDQTQAFAPVTATTEVFEQVRAPEQLRVVLSTTEVELAPGGEPVSVDVEVQNLSDIVDAYVVDIPDAPAWLELDSSDVRLMPNSSGTLRVTLRLRTGVLPVAQTIRVSARVRSHAASGLMSTHALTVSVSEIDRPVVLRVEPSVIRVKDQPGGDFVVVADNSANNHPVHLELRSRDAEDVMAVAFRSATLDVPAGGIASAPAHVEAPLPEPGEEASRQLTVSAFDGTRMAHAVVTFTQRTSIPRAEPPIALRLNPSVIQATDARVGQLRLEIDNTFGSQAARIVLSAYDAEGAVRFTFTPQVADVAAGRTASVLIGLDAPMPEPGGEALRQFTLVARYGTRTAEASGTFRQRTSPPSLNAIKLRIEPPMVRVRDTDHGRTRVVADNRLGTRPAECGWRAVITRAPPASPSPHRTSTYTRASRQAPMSLSGCGVRPLAPRGRVASRSVGRTASTKSSRKARSRRPLQTAGRCGARCSLLSAPC
jgi:hypothetical protein